MAPTATFEHVHLLHRDDDELAALVADEAVAGLDGGDAVLVCLPERQWDGVERRLGATAAAAVTYVPASDRYARPIDAIVMLAEFVERAGRGVRSIGAISYSGTPADAPWLRYEAAVDEVFADVPLRAVCVANEVELPADLLAALEVVHDHDAASKRSLLRALPPSAPLPVRPADVALPVDDHAAARRALRAALAPVLGGEAVADLELVATELLVNADRYAAGATAARAWLEPGEVVLAVADGGTGPVAASAGLRNAGGALGGRGLWIVHQLCAAVDFVVDEGGHTVVARYAR